MSTFIATSEGKQQFALNLSADGLDVDGIPSEASLEILSTGFHRLHVDGKTYNVFCKKNSEILFEIWINHFIFSVTVEDMRPKLLQQVSKFTHSGSESMIIKAPMPGLVTAIEVQIGDIIQPGTGLFVLEAMKMENEIRSTVHGRVKSIEVQNRMTVEKNQKMLTLEPIS